MLPDFHLRRHARRGSAGFAVRRCLAVVVLAVSMLPLAASAAEVANLYTTRVAWDRAQDRERKDAYRDALADVLIRVTGRVDAAGDPLLLGAFPNPADYVIGYRPAADETLWVSFDGRSIEATLASVNAPVWGSDRPLTVVWLAVERDNGERELIVAGNSARADQTPGTVATEPDLRERLTSAADRRGIPVIFPLGDTADRTGVQAGDIWGGFDERIAEQSARYGASSFLIGRAERGRAERIRWTWIFGGDRREFQGPVESAVARMTDGMADLLAVSAQSRPLAIVLDVEGLATVDAYGATLSHLRSLPQVRRLDVRSATGDVVRFELEAIGSLEQFTRALTGSGLLRGLPSAAPLLDNQADGAIPRDYLRANFEG